MSPNSLALRRLRAADMPPQRCSRLERMRVTLGDGARTTLHVAIYERNAFSARVVLLRRPAPLEQQKISALGIDYDQDGFGPAKLLQASIDLGRRTHANVQFAKLSFAYLSGRIHQEIRSSLRLGKGNHVADAVGTGHEHREPVETKGNAAMRRCPQLERIEQESELQTSLVRGYAQQVEDGGLQFLIVDPDRAPANL